MIRPRSYSIASADGSASCSSSTRSCSLPRSVRGGLHSSLQDIRYSPAEGGGEGTGSGGGGGGGGGYPYMSRTYPSGNGSSVSDRSRASRHFRPKMSESFERNFFRPIDRQDGEITSVHFYFFKGHIFCNTTSVYFISVARNSSLSVLKERMVSRRTHSSSFVWVSC